MPGENGRSCQAQIRTALFYFRSWAMSKVFRAKFMQEWGKHVKVPQVTRKQLFEKEMGGIQQSTLQWGGKRSLSTWDVTHTGQPSAMPESSELPIRPLCLTTRITGMEENIK